MAAGDILLIEDETSRPWRWNGTTWQTATTHVPGGQDQETDPYGIAVLADGRLVVSGLYSGRLFYWHGTGWESAPPPNGDRPMGLSAAPNGDLLAAGPMFKQVWRYEGRDWSTEALLFELPLDVTIAADGGLIVATRSGIHRRDGDRWHPVAVTVDPATGEWMPRGVATALDGDLLVTFDNVPRVYRWDWGDRWTVEVPTMPPGGDSPEGIAVDPG